MKPTINRFLSISTTFGLFATSSAMQFIVSSAAHAASATWSATAGDANWATAGNWSAGSPGSTSALSTDIATFSTALNGTIGGASNPIVIDSGRRIGGIAFSTGAGAYVIGSNAGNVLTLGTRGAGYNGSSSIVVNSGVVASQVIAAPLTFVQPSSTNGQFGIVNNAVSSSVTLSLTGGMTLAAGRPVIVVLDGTNTGLNTLGGTISFTGSTQGTPLMVKRGAGTWVISGANTMSGTAATSTDSNFGIQVLDGVLSLRNNDALGSAAQVWVGNKSTTYVQNSTFTTSYSSVTGGTLEVASGITLNNGLTLNLWNSGTIRGNGTNTINSIVRVSSATATVGTLSTLLASDVLTIGNGANDLTGGASDSELRISGPGTVVLSQASNYAGRVNVVDGTLRIGSATALGTQGILNISSGATMQTFGAVSPALSAFTGSGILENGAVGTSTVAANISSGTNSFGGTIQNGSAGTLALTKGGVGVLTLSGASSYTGATALNAGTLNLTGSLGNTTVTVASGATLAGDGSVSGAANLAAAGARVAPGNSGVGTLTIGTLTLGAGSQLDYQITDTSTMDRITVSTNNGLRINGGVLNINGGTGLFTANGVYNLIGYSGTIGGTGVSALSVNGSNRDDATKSYSFGSTGSFVTLVVANAAVSANFWNTNSNGIWSDVGNWTGGVPNGVSAFAAFGGGGIEISADRTINVDSGFTLGTLSLNGAANGKSYTLADSGGSLTFDNGANAAALTNTAGSNSIQAAMALTANGAVATVTQQADTLSVSGSIGGTGALTKAGVGTLLLSGDNSFVGNTTINSGVLAISSASSLGAAGNSVTINAATLRATQTISSSRNISLGDAASTVSVDSARSYTIGGVVSGSGGLNKAGAGTLLLTGTNTYTGGTALNNGTVVINSATSLGDAAGAVVIGNATLQSTANISSGRAFSLTSSGSSFSVGSGTTYTVSGVVSGSGTLNKTGAGTLLLSNTSNSFANTVIAGGTLALGGGQLVGNAAIGSGTITFQGGTLNSNWLGQSDNGSASFGFANNFIVPSGETGTVNMARRAFSSGSLTGSGTFNVNIDGVRDEFSGNWSAFTGQINVGTVASAGDFRINTVAGFGTAKLNLASGVSMYVINNFGAGGATLNIGELSGAATSSLAGGPTGGRVATFNVGGANTDATYQGVLKDSAGITAITKSGSGRWVLTGTNLYTGTTTVSGGVLQIGDGGTSGSLGTANVVNNASLVFNRSNSMVVNNAISGNGTLTKQGAGTLELAGSNSYGGATTVSAGKLVVSGGLTNSVVTASNSGTVIASDSSATLGRGVNMGNGTVLAAGDFNNIGVASVGSSGTTFNGGSIFSWDVSSDGSSYDKLVTSSLGGEGATFRVVVSNENFWTTNRTWTDIFTTNGTDAVASWAGVFSNLTVVDSSFNPVIPSNGSFSVSGSTLSWSAVPEPTSALAGLLLGAGLLRRRRK